MLAIIGDPFSTPSPDVKKIFGRDSITDDDAKKLAGKLEKNCVITDLDLSYNSIHSPGVDALGKALRTNRHVTSLNLRANIGCMMSSGNSALALSLKENKTLTELNLSVIGLGDNDLMKLCAGVLHSRTLRILNISGNDIGEHGARVISITLGGTAAKPDQRNQSLRILDLSHNKIRGAGVQFLSEMMDRNWNLLKVDLEGNGISISDYVGGMAAGDIHFALSRNVMHHAITAVHSLFQSDTHFFPHLTILICTYAFEEYKKPGPGESDVSTETMAQRRTKRWLPPPMLRW